MKALPAGGGGLLLGAVLWSPEFFSSTVGLNEAVIRRYVDHQERVDKGHMQHNFEF
jgi:REP element-mobilizing transposase RayT